MSRFGVRGWVGAVTVALVASLLPGMAATTAAVAATEGPDLPSLKQPPTVAVKKMTAGRTKRPVDAAARTWKPPKVTWPAPGSAIVDIAASSTATGSVAQRAGGLPVAIGSIPAKPTKSRTAAQAPGKVKVTLADMAVTRKAGVDGILFSVARPDATAPGSAHVQVDYTTFRGAYGGDWAARLRLVQLPACALITPDNPACRIGTPLATTNKTKSGTLSATVVVPGTADAVGRAPRGQSAAAGAVLAVTAGDSGLTGTYKATDLQASGSWTAGGSTGAFTWSYPIGVPSVPGGLQPSISMDYNSQSVDGRTAASNSQPGWIGDGWSWEPGFIERRYKPCNDDKQGGTNTAKVGDLCWYNDNATLSLGGKSTELVHDSVKGWHPANDSGEKVEKLTGASNPDSGTAGVDGVGEHWKITSTDGTQYFFGLNKLPGWRDNGTAADDPVTNSTWTKPVFGNQTGEPCYNASFASAWCQQAWRWQLDYVVDPRGNAMAYYWKTESNNYGRNVSETTGNSTVTPYIRNGYLDRIDYGLRSGSAYSAKAMGQVHFGVEERCLTNCGTFDQANAAKWPDVPFDQYCKDGATACTDQYSPTFWSRKRLTGISTKVLVGGVYKDVDSWAFTQNFPPSGDGVSTPMWLKSITRTGKAGGTVALPPVTFEGVQKPNRVDALGDGLAPFIRLRMSKIVTETGGAIGVDYLDPGCTPSAPPPTDGTNSTRCYPVKWAFEGDTARMDWFNSYAAQRVIEDDNLAATPDTVTEYAYVGGAKWAKSTDEFTKADDRTHSIARGHYQVETRKGAGATPKTLSEARYFRGIDGAAVNNSAGIAVTDREQFAGMLRESATYNGDGGALVTATSYTPWRSARTATRARTGLPDLEAYLTGTEAEETRTTVTGGFRTTKLTRDFDSYGMVTNVSDHGDTAEPGDEKCTTTQYARNTSAWILSTVSRVETVAALCNAPVNRPADVTDDIRTFYDGGTFGTAPTKGLITASDRINGAGNAYDTVMSVPSTCGTNANQLCADQYGRALKVADAYAKVTSTAFTPATGETPTTAVVTNPLNHTMTELLDPLRGQPIKTTDANGKVTTTAYDALGRATKVWTPTRSAATFPNAPNYTFDYLVRNNNPTVVTTRVLDHNSEYQTSYAFHDGLLRPRQTQAKSPDNAGRLVSETFYNTRGEAWLASGTYFAAGAPAAVLVTGQETLYPASTETVFDGASRPTAVIDKKFGDETKRTTTSYTGDTTTVVPPQGGTTTTTVTDALGRTTQLRQHTGTGPAAFQSTDRTYDQHGRLHTVKDPSNATWTYTYDVRGRQTGTNDPDKGTSVTTYDKGDRAIAVKDARNTTLDTTYDALGRRTALKKGTTTLSAWTYDTIAKGQPTSATRYDGTNAYISEITEYGDLYQPASTMVTVPGATGQPAVQYEWFTFFADNTGQPVATEHPAIGGLPAETVSTTYNTSGLLDSVYAGNDPLISAATYDHYGRTSRLEYGEFARQLFITNEFDDHTGNLTRAYKDREVAPQRIEDTQYHYDPAGNIKQIATAYGQDTSRTTDTQCFALDALRRITEAWTNTGEACAATPSASVVGGQDPYWTSYAYDAVGNRTTESQHQTASGPTADTTRTYQAPPAGKHSLPKVTQTGINPHEENFTYDAAGNTATRKAGTADIQNLVWDDEGHLKEVTQGTKTSSYLYDTEGQRLIRKDSTGTTLYLPGGNELHTDKVGLATGTRYYSAGNSSLAMRTGTQLTFTLTDHHNTTTTQVTADTALAVTRRKTTIFGAPRGTQPTTWKGDRTFVGGTKDTDTGLTHLGAREYDPTVGRFISVDPIMDLADAQQMHGYTYGNNNPVVISDPTGLYGAWCANITCVNQTGGPGTAPTSYPKPTHTKGSGGGGSGKNSGGGSGGGGGGHSGNGGGSGGGGHSGGKKKSSKPDRNWGESIYYGVGEVFYGAISTVPYAAEMGGWLVDSDCWNEGGPGSPGCDYGSQYDNYMESQGYDTSSAAYQIPGLLGALFGRKPAKPAKPKPTRCPNSFLAGTDVLMADGTTKNIEDIEVGNTVIATNPETGESGPRKVTQLITTKSDKADKGLNRLTIATDDGIQPLTATNEHPFWSPSGSRWLDAADLAKGMTLLTDDGDTVTVTANRPFTRHTKTYNLTVDDLHTYYVLAGQTPVLVHNSGPCGISTRNEKAGDIGNYTDGQKTRDPASQWYHEELSNDELLDGINNPGDGDGILVSRDGKILGGHHRKDELQRRIQDGRIDPDTEIRIDVYDPE